MSSIYSKFTSHARKWGYKKKSIKQIHSRFYLLALSQFSLNIELKYDSKLSKFGNIEKDSKGF